MSERVDFSRNANIYDRRHGAAVADDELSTLWSTASLQPDARVLDIGAGTGRIAIPLAARGCEVVTIEPSQGMLEQLRRMIPVSSLSIGSGPEVTIREFLRRLVTGELSYIWNVPEEVRTQSLPVLEAWWPRTSISINRWRCLANFGGRSIAINQPDVTCDET